MLLSGKQSIRQKLLLVVALTTLTALLTSGVAMLYYDFRTSRQAWIRDLTTQADVLGRASAPALSFDDPKTARDSLQVLKARPEITAAAIYTAKGRLFASYAAPGLADAHLPNLPEVDGYEIDSRELQVFKRIIDEHEILGTVYLRASHQLFSRVRDYCVILGMVTAAGLLMALALSSRLNAAVAGPIVAMSGVARRVMESRDFSLRVSKTTEDEIGTLADAFNGMLSEIGRRAEILEESNRKLGAEIAERRGAEEALRLSERRNRSLVDASSAVVWMADGGGRFAEEVPSWSDYTGQAREQYQGLGWRRAFAPADQAALEAAWETALAHPGPFGLELRLWHASTQRHRHVSVRGVPLIGADGAPGEWIGTISDIDDQRRAEQELRELNTELETRVASRTAELEAANKELESFSYSVSHDLRSPLRAVAGFARLLWEDHAEQLDEEARRKLGFVQGEAQRMGVLIDDLLAFSRLGRQAMQSGPLEMQKIAHDVYERLLVQHAGPPVKFQLGTLPPAQGDRVLLEQVWANFLSNAIKFSAKREHPVIEVGAVSDEKEHIYFVRDNGAGFDPRYTAKLFGVFQRLHDAEDFAGTGVGLALVARIVNRHGGRVWAEGKLDHGATFYFTLPKEPVDGSD
ncbi:MAG TPA: ATP-binding protein [Burkholderiales bacterium]|jgi:PAS domain S-box-containing protein|nr:ATP-binding protein [Burkholderiales bacterium]